MYEAFFGLKELPFNITPDPRFIYLSDHHQKALSALSNGVESRRGFIQITGEIGTGKTTLCRALLEKLEWQGSYLFVVQSQTLGIRNPPSHRGGFWDPAFGQKTERLF